MSQRRRKGTGPSAVRTSDQRSCSADFAFWGVSLCFLLSGAAGLVYQMVWVRYLSTVFGTSELAIITVLVGYMGGLAVGAWAASKLVHALKRPILIYAFLEASIAGSALLVPWLLRFVGNLHLAILGGQPSPPVDGGIVEALAHLGLGCFVLFVPTACMGATLPILAKGVIHRSEQIGSRLGWLYALNTFGAAAGTVIAAFFLIPRLGLWHTSFVAVGLNFLVAALGWLVANRAFARSPDSAPKTELPDRAASAPVRSAFAFVILGVMLVSGSVSFAYEVLWTRLLTHILGGSLYAFATMLAAFLAGIAIGGLLGGKIAVGRRESCLWLAAVEIATGILTAGVFHIIASSGFTGSNWEDPTLFFQATLCAMILMPATLCLGATFPLAVRSLTDDPSGAGRFAGLAYSWNTVGAILGAVGAGYVLVPAIGYAGAFKCAVSINLLLGLLVLLTVRPAAELFAAGAAILALGCLFVYQPQAPLRLLTISPSTSPKPGLTEAKLIHHAVGRSATVAVLLHRGSYLLRTNGLPEAEIFPKGGANLSYTRIRWLPALPKVLHPETESLLVVGYGGGTLLEAVPSGIKSIDVVELEPEVIRANELLADKRAIDPLEDARINIIINDARGALQLTTKRYDAIVSQPSHPWTAGASHLYTQEFFELAKDHLTRDGLFVQWLGTRFADERLLRSLCATMVEVFPHVQLYLVAEDNFLFVGSGTSLEARFLDGAREDGFLFHLSEYPELSFVEDVLAVLQLDEAGCRQLAEGHLPITDDNNLMATHLFRSAKMPGAHNELLKRVIAPIHYLNRDAPGLLNRFSTKPINFRYLAMLLQRNSPYVDLRRYREKTMPRADRIVMAASAVRQPDKVLDVLEQASLLGSDNVSARYLEARARFLVNLRNWSSRKSAFLPHEFLQFIDNHDVLRAAVEKLTDRQRALMEAEYWTLTSQIARVRGLEPELRSFNDHRDVSFTTAAKVRLRYLLHPEGKSAQEQAADARTATRLLDQLLFLPLAQNLPFVSERIALAQRFNDMDYLTATGWSLVGTSSRVPANAPAQYKEIFRRLLGEILTPYAAKTEDGRFRFSGPAIEKFYHQVLQSGAAEALPETFQP